MNRNKVIIFCLSFVLLALIALGVVIGCSTCSTCESAGGWNKRSARLAAEEAARLEAERLAAEEEAARLEAERLEAERLAAEAEADRLEAERRAAEARRRSAAASSSQSGAGTQQQYNSSESSADNPFVGVWANSNQTIVVRFRPNGNIEVLNYDIIDELVEVYWRTNRALSEGGFYDTRNPEATESKYTGTGTYTVNKDSVSFVLDLENQRGMTKNINHSSKFTMNNQKNSFRLASGLARKFIINRETRKVHSTKEYVTSFTRQ